MTDPHRRRALGWLALGAASVTTTVLARRWLPAHSAAPAVPPARETPLAAAPHAAAPQAAAKERFPNALARHRADGLGSELPLRPALTLAARSDAFAIFPGAATPLWHYAAQVDGRRYADPLLRVRRGEALDVRFENHLDEATTVHWHGLLVDEANDGSGLHPVAAGGEARYRFDVRNRAGLYWYHAHPHGRTGVQVQRGLAGLLLVEDDEERVLRERLGLAWGERDVALLIADKQIGADNAIQYDEHEPDDWIGNRVLVNWTPEPHLDVAPALHRFRLANTSNARMLRLAFEHRGTPLPFHLIGVDGGLLAQPWRIEDLFLAPAQRADVLVDFAALPPGARVLLRSLDYVAMENEDESGEFAPDPMGDHPGAMPMGHALDVMEFRVAAASAAPSAPTPIPQRLCDLADPPDTRGWPVRPLRLRMDAQGTWYINDWNFHHTGHAPAFSVKRGSREVWEIRNSMTSMPHPIHLHGFQFRVVSRSISPPDIRARAVAGNGLGPQDLGVSDTVVVWPGETVRIALDFSQPLRGTQRYMLHCHNLEHEDKGMMITFAVVD